MNIVFENGLVKAAQVVTDKITAKEVCIEDVCVNKEQLKALLEQNGQTPVPTPTPSPEPEQSPTPSPESTPEATPEPTSELTLEPTPEQP